MADSTLTTIMVGLLDENPANPRKTFDDGKLAELAESIKSVGLLQPIVVRPTRKRYEIVCGHRRVRAAKLAGVFEVPAIVRKLTDREAGYAALVENGQRADVAPLEEGAAFDALVQLGEDVANIAATVGHPPRYVKDRIKLQQLSETLRPALASGQLPLGGALLVATLPRERQDELAKKALKPDPAAKAWTVDAVRNAVLQSSVALSKALWGLDDATYTPIACTSCTSRSDAQAELFAGSYVATDAACLLRQCWDAKREQYFARKAAEGYTIHKELNPPLGWVHPSWCIGVGQLTWGEVAAAETPKLLLNNEWASGRVEWLHQPTILAQLEREGRPALIAVETPESKEAAKAREAARLEAYDDDVTQLGYLLEQVVSEASDDEVMRAATVALIQLAARNLWSFDAILLRRWGFSPLNNRAAFGDTAEGTLLPDSSPEAVRKLFADALAIIVRELAGHNSRAAYRQLCKLSGVVVEKEDLDESDGEGDGEGDGDDQYDDEGDLDPEDDDTGDTDADGVVEG